jgi:hypothetical protein
VRASSPVCPFLTPSTEPTDPHRAVRSLPPSTCLFSLDRLDTSAWPCAAVQLGAAVPVPWPMGRRARPETGVLMPTALFSQAVMTRPVRLVQRRAEARERALGRAVPLWRGMAWRGDAAALCCETAAVRR